MSTSDKFPARSVPGMDGQESGTILCGRYRLEEFVGQGASAEVYRGTQLGIERRVAIKFLKGSAERSREMQARFLLEAQSTARLDHPHIIKLYDLGRREKGQPFQVLEWFDGMPLCEHPMAKSPFLRVREQFALRVGQQIASALACAHQNRIVHRDLKPDNVLVRGLEEPEIRVLDFGIAKQQDRGPGLHTELTKHGEIYGTPNYMSPEQACALPAEPRSDLYSLGIMLYEIIAGRLPFATTGVQILVDHLETVPEALEELVDGPNVKLAALVSQLLQKEPKDRVASAALVQEKLREIAAEVASGAAQPEKASPIARQCVPEKKTMPRDQVPTRPTARPRRHLVAAAMALLFLGANSGDGLALAQEAAQDLVEGLAKRWGGEANTIGQHAPSPMVTTEARRAQVLSTNDWTLRILTPETVRVGSDSLMHIEVWNERGRPMTPRELDLMMFDSEGLGVPVAPYAVRSPGTFEFVHRFAKSGEYALHIRPYGEDSAVKVFLAVE